MNMNAPWVKQAAIAKEKGLSVCFDELSHMTDISEFMLFLGAVINAELVADDKQFEDELQEIVYYLEDLEDDHDVDMEKVLDMFAKVCDDKLVRDFSSLELN